MASSAKNILKPSAVDYNHLSAYDYILPPSLIAHTPTQKRDASRLLISAPNTPIHTNNHFEDILKHLNPGDILVMNNTRVLPARLYGWRTKEEIKNGIKVRGKLEVEVLLHRATGAENTWQAFCKPAKKLKIGHYIHFDGGKAEVIGRSDEETTLKFFDFGPDFEAFLKKTGQMPLPPYITRENGHTEEDLERYQTVYAQHKGAVAAPTAGLHFTKELLAALQNKGIKTEFVTLHVGAGTFQPVREEDLSHHKMHTEWGEVTPQVAEKLQQAKQKGHRIVCVGTTSLRLLESAAKTGTIKPFKGDTDIFIKPGFTFNAADGLITNFHLPRSTLLMLVAAFVGYSNMHQIYKTAIAENFRFYSYGDSSLLWKKTNDAL